MQRFLRWFAFVWSVVVYVALLGISVYSQVSDTLSTDGSHVRTIGRETLASVNGAAVYMTIAVPVIAAALVILPLSGRSRRAADIASVLIVAGFVLLGMMSVGMFFIPTALALVALTVRPDPTQSVAGPR
jgi:hypothetical protein